MQKDRIILVGEVIGALDLAKHITVRTKYIESREVVIYINNKRVLVAYNKQIKREGEITTEVDGIIAEIINEMNRLLSAQPN